MTGRFAAELAEILDLVERQGGSRKHLAVSCYFSYARQMQQGVQQHRGVPVGEDETVAIRPDGIFGVIAKELLPEAISDRSQRHGRSGMARVRLLHRVHRKGANRVDTELIELRTGGGDRLVTDCHQILSLQIGLPYPTGGL